MSHVTDVFLLASSSDDDEDYPDPIQPLQKWLATEDKPPLKRIDDFAGGDKFMQATVWAGAFNHLNIPQFIARVWACRWQDRDRVQILIKDEQDDLWALHGYVAPVRETEFGAVDPEDEERWGTA